MGKHDTSYKQFFSHPQMVQELLESFVKEDWVKRFDFSTLKRCFSSYITDKTREQSDDIVWKVKFGDQDLYLYLLLEFQSSTDDFMAVRIMSYVALLYQDIIKAEKKKKGDLLPPVLPIVLYNGLAEWEAKTNIYNLIQAPPAGLDKFVPKLEYLLIDEARANPKELEELGNCISALFQLENCQTPQNFYNVIGNLISWLNSPQQNSLKRAFTVWINRVLLRGKLVDKIPDNISLEEVQTMLEERIIQWPVEWEKAGVQKGLEKGMQKGLEKGMQKGLEKGERKKAIEVAINMLKENYPLATIVKLTALDLETLEKLKGKHSTDSTVQEKPDKYSA